MISCLKTSARWFKCISKHWSRFWASGPSFSRSKCRCKWILCRKRKKSTNLSSKPTQTSISTSTRDKRMTFGRSVQSGTLSRSLWTRPARKTCTSPNPTTLQSWTQQFNRTWTTSSSSKGTKCLECLSRSVSKTHRRLTRMKYPLTSPWSLTPNWSACPVSLRTSWSKRRRKWSSSESERTAKKGIKTQVSTRAMDCMPPGKTKRTTTISTTTKCRLRWPTALIRSTSRRRQSTTVT